MTLKNNKIISLLLCVITISIPVFVFAETQDEKETRLGKDAVVTIEKELKLLTDEALQTRINVIGKKIAEIAISEELPATFGSTRLSPFEYSFKIIDDKDVNAFSIPGGFIYINKGLIDFAESDDELAGVIAHEIAHVAHHHMMELIEKQNKMQSQVLLPLLVALVVGRPSAGDTATLLQGAQLFQIAKSNLWGQDAERDSDASAVRLMLKAGYNPVGVFTFMDRLARKELTKPNIDWGIYRTHPLSYERAEAIKTLIDELKIPFALSSVSSSLRVKVRPVAENTQGLYEVYYDDYVIYQPVGDEVNGSSEARANVLANTLNTFFDSGPELYRVKLIKDKQQIIAGDSIFVELTPADITASNLTSDELLAKTLKVVKSAVNKYRQKRVY